MHVMFFTLVIAAAMVGVAVLFVCWLVVTLLRGFTRLLLGPGLKPPPPLMQNRPGARTCPRPSCHAINPVTARFCRRCGQRFDAPEQVAVRRAVML